ncbi:hypothetical protein [Puia sp.]|jgi:hypothetical protein|uniref:hypothetical protein n=1 Tax=Puia sp. TaxID=2045100 RepID=UPI002F424B47
MSPFYKRLFLTVLIAGSLDLTYAYTAGYIRNGRLSTKMFQYIAGGALGLKNSLNGGVPVILLGIFFHYFIVTCFTLFFFFLYRKNRIFGLNKYIAGLLYGFFIWSVMNLVVLPLSALPSATVNIEKALLDAVLLGVVIGLPVSLSASRYYGDARPQVQ